MQRMLEEMKEMLTAVVNDEKLIPTLARGYKKMLLSLVAEGFSREEAMQILVSQGIGINKNN